MDKKFNSRLNMFGSVNDVFNEYASDWAGYAPMVTSVEVFRGQRTGILVTRQKQERDLTGLAIDKGLVRGDMASRAISVCGKVKAWCYATGDVVGYNEMHITRTMIMNGQSSRAQTLSQSICDKATAMPAADKTSFNVLASEITELQDSINIYESVQTLPRTAISGRKTETDSFKKLFTDCTITLKRSIDNLMENFAGTEFYVRYFSARRIVDDATQKANLAVTVLSDYDGSPLAGALVHGTDGVSTFEDMTDSEGRVKRSEIHSDLWQLTITHANFVGATVEADIYPGDKEKVLVKLKPV